MQFRYYMPTEIVVGRGCVVEQGEKLKLLGSHALIVSGKSAHKNGALEDVLTALSENGQQATVFDRVTPNPTVACVREGVALLNSVGADFLVAIGGGSPMDACKAIATLAVEERSDEEIFSGGYTRALPMAHIPTTAGTGSEVTPYSILTNDAKQTKTSISSPAMFPRVAFLDGKYLCSLPQASVVNPAIDAFSHAVESLLSRQSTPLSEILAKESLHRIYPLLKRLVVRSHTAEEFDELLYASTLAGMAIAQSGTTAVHGMGYYLTYFHNIDHGRANGLLLGETLKLCREKQLAEVEQIETACGDPLTEIIGTLDELLGTREKLPQAEIAEFATRSMSNKNIKKSKYEPTETEVLRIFSRSVG